MFDGNAVPAGPAGRRRGCARSDARRGEPLRYDAGMSLRRGSTPSRRLACGLAVSLCLAPGPAAIASSPPAARPGEAAAKRGDDLLSVGDRKLAAGDKAGASTLYSQAVREFLTAADELRGRPGNLLDLRSDHVSLALKVQLQAHEASPRPDDELRQLHVWTRTTLAELEQLQADPAVLAELRELLARIPDPPAAAPEGPREVASVAPSGGADAAAEPRPAAPTRARGLAAGLGVSAGLTGVSAVVLAVGYSSMTRSWASAQAAADDAVMNHGLMLARGDSPCTDDLRAVPAYGLDGPCGAHARGQAAALAGAVGVGVAGVATIVLAALLARARRGQAPSSGRGTATVTPVLRGGVIISGTWRF